jgi:hypothetical protein
VGASEVDSKPLFDIFAIRNDNALLDGALRAVAMLRRKFGDDCAARIIDGVVARKKQHAWFGAAGAYPGRSEAAVVTFLDQCLQSDREDINTAASAAKLKKYLKWNPH